MIICFLDPNKKLSLLLPQRSIKKNNKFTTAFALKHHLNQQTAAGKSAVHRIRNFIYDSEA